MPGKLTPIESRLVRDGTCLMWTGARNSRGYGHFRRGGRNWYVHRWMYEKYVGPIPDGLTIDHLCGNRLCANVEHLEVVTRGENTLRGDGFARRNARKTHCKRGHPFDLFNTYWRPDGKGRQCRECGRLRQARRK